MTEPDLSRDRYFWLAAVLSVCLHAGAFGFIYALGVVWGPPLTPPMPILPYGDATVEGLSVDAVALHSGSLWQDEHDRPGGALVQGIPVKPLDLPKPVETAPPKEPPKTEPEPMPFVSQEVTPISSAPDPEPQQQPPPAKTAENPEPKPTDTRGTAPKSGTESAPASTSNSLPGVGRSPGAQGSSRLAEGTPSAGGRVGFQTGVSMVGYQKPLYPNEAKLAGMQGTVLIWLNVSAEGKVTAAKVQQSCGYALLDNTALQFAYTIQFRPARQGTTPVAADATLPVVFRLLDR
jgi:protein TonB